MAVGLLLGAAVAAGVIFTLLAMRPEPDTAAQLAGTIAQQMQTATDEQTQRLSGEMHDSIQQLTDKANQAAAPLSQLAEKLERQQQQITRLQADMELVSRMVSLQNRSVYQQHIDAGTKAHLAGDYEAAVMHFSKALAISPDALRAYLNRGMSHQELGHWTAALADFRAAQKIDEENFAPWNNIAWLLATCPDDEVRSGDEAVIAAERACELSGWKNYAAISTLGAALAETGDFESAFRRMEEAAELAPQDAKPAIEEQMADFQQEKPLRLGGVADSPAPRP